MVPKRSAGVAYESELASRGFAVAAALAAGALSLLACLAGSTARSEDFEGVRPLLAAALLGVAGLMTSVMARSGPTSPTVRRLLGGVATTATMAVACVFFAAAPGAPASNDSWGEVSAAVLGLWTALMALSLLAERAMWRFVAAASVALLVASLAA